MEYLSWLFFCLSPFALFCSEDGNGIVLSVVFIILGFLFKYAGNNNGGGAVVKIEPHKFWEWHYKDRMRSTLEQKDTINDGLMALKDKEARDWATTVCGYHSAPVPSEEQQEQIARANGVITEKMIIKRNEEKDRIQVGKHVLMNELMGKYGATKKGEVIDSICCFTIARIKKDIDKIKASNNEYITEYWAHTKYKKKLKEIWNSLSEEEKNQAMRWIEEYEKQLVVAVHERAYRKRQDDNVDMDF